MQTQGLTRGVSALPGSLAEHAGLQVWGSRAAYLLGQTVCFVGGDDC